MKLGQAIEKQTCIIYNLDISFSAATIPLMQFGSKNHQPG